MRYAIAIATLWSAACLADTTLPKRPPVDCRDAEHRAIEFWVGDWSVADTRSGAVIARSTIEWIVGGCAIRESYSQDVGPGGRAIDYHGTSYTALDTLEHAWRQFYVDSNGTASNFRGAIENGALVMAVQKGPVTNRMTIAPQPDGSVRQSGESSTDGGKTFTAGYDFTYRRR